MVWLLVLPNDGWPCVYDFRRRPVLAPGGPDSLRRASETVATTIRTRRRTQPATKAERRRRPLRTRALSRGRRRRPVRTLVRDGWPGIEPAAVASGGSPAGLLWLLRSLVDRCFGRSKKSLSRLLVFLERGLSLIRLYECSQSCNRDTPSSKAHFAPRQLTFAKESADGVWVHLKTLRRLLDCQQLIAHRSHNATEDSVTSK
jgi:hypothetical protein